MLNKKIVPWFAGSLMLALLGLMSFTNQGFAQDNATASPDAPEAAVDAATPADAPEEVATIDSGDTAWMIVATLLVLFMTIPGLSLFYGGLVRSKSAPPQRATPPNPQRLRRVRTAASSCPRTLPRSSTSAMTSLQCRIGGPRLRDRP